MSAPNQCVQRTPRRVTPRAWHGSRRLGVLLTNALGENVCLMRKLR